MNIVLCGRLLQQLPVKNVDLIVNQVSPVDLLIESLDADDEAASIAVNDGSILLQILQKPIDDDLKAASIKEPACASLIEVQVIQT